MCKLPYIEVESLCNASKLVVKKLMHGKQKIGHLCPVVS